jgi:hypothetical protein
MNINDTIQTKYECISIQVESAVKDARSARSKEKEEFETDKNVQQSSKREEITMSIELIILIIVLVLLFGGGGGYYWSRRG